MDTSKIEEFVFSERENGADIYNMRLLGSKTEDLWSTTMKEVCGERFKDWLGTIL
jgi:hypothetical protein